MMLDKTQARRLYIQGLSTRQIATALSVSKSWVYQVVKLFVRSKSVAAQLRQPATSKHWRSARQAARQKWKRERGQIPCGWHVHHKDGDFTNNDIGNLEILPARDHAHHHHPPNPVIRHLRPERQKYMQQYLRGYRQRRKERIASVG